MSTPILILARTSGGLLVGTRLNHMPDLPEDLDRFDLSQIHTNLLVRSNGYSTMQDLEYGDDYSDGDIEQVTLSDESEIPDALKDSHYFYGAMILSKVTEDERTDLAAFIQEIKDDAAECGDSMSDEEAFDEAVMNTWTQGTFLSNDRMWTMEHVQFGGRKGR